MSVWKKTQCNFCQACCGLEMEVEDNHIINVRPDPDSPRSKHTYCCRRGRSAKYFQDHEDRLNYPLKKVGDKHVRISWEQAYKEIGKRPMQSWRNTDQMRFSGLAEVTLLSWDLERQALNCKC